MRGKIVLGLGLLCLFVSCDVIGRARRTVYSQTRFLDAISQRTIPGARDMQPTTAWKFILIWQGGEPPTTFFWRPDANRWMTTSVTRIHNYSKAREGGLSAYSNEEIDLKNVRRGDTLEIVAMPMGRDAMPSSLKNKQKAALYYQTNLLGQWHYLTPAVRKLEDIMMP